MCASLRLCLRPFVGVFVFVFFLAPIWVSNFFAGPFITAGLNQQGRAESSDKLYCILST